METYISKDLIFGSLTLSRNTKCYLLNKESKGICEVFVYGKDLSIGFPFHNDLESNEYNNICLQGMVFCIHIDFIYAKSNGITMPLLEVKDRNKIVTCFEQTLEI